MGDTEYKQYYYQQVLLVRPERYNCVVGPTDPLSHSTLLKELQVVRILSSLRKDYQSQIQLR